MALSESQEVPGERIGSDRGGAGGRESETTCLAVAKGFGRDQAECGGEESFQHHVAGDALQ